MRKFLEDKKSSETGLVPTMGYLHEGHLSLIERSVKENRFTVVSVFVNPTQFGPGEDLETYPRDLERDAELCEKAGAHAVFAPSGREMYGENMNNVWVSVEGLTDMLCGASRPGHFRGVCTVVTKLFNIIRPGNAYFGMKDYQQYRVLHTMARGLNMDIRVVPCPIVREKDGLAMSSRNKYLSKEERVDALVLSRALKTAEALIEKGERDTGALLAQAKKVVDSAQSSKIDYMEAVHPKTLKRIERIGEEGVLIALAVYIGSTRLIDNMLWTYDK